MERKAIPARQQVRRVVARVYRTAIPEIPSTAFHLVGMSRLLSARMARK